MTFLGWAAPDSSELSRLLATLDWAATPLGAPQRWSEALRRTLRMMLVSRQQMVLFWGPRYVALYNDACLPVIGTRHPVLLGRPALEHWGESWHVLPPLLDRVVESGESCWSHDHPFPMLRHGCPEFTYLDISYDPVPFEDGRVGGVLCLVTETTGRVLSERRMRTVSELGAGTAGSVRADQVAREAITALAGNPDDVPFAQIYLCVPGMLRRVASTLDEPDAGRLVIEPGDGTPAGTVTAQVLSSGRAGSAVAAAFTGPAARPAGEVALALPIVGATGVDGVLVAGVNPLLRLPGAYREFYDLLATTVSGAVATATVQAQRCRRAAGRPELPRQLPRRPNHESDWQLALVDSLQDGFVVTTADGTVIEMNEAFTALLGHPAQDLPYPAPPPWWPDPDADPDGFQQAGAAFATVLQSGEGRFLLPLRHRDGRQVWAAIVVAAVHDPDGQRQLFVSTYRDATTEYLAAQRNAVLARFTDRLVGARGVREVLDAGLAEFRDRWSMRQVFAACWGSGGQPELISHDTCWTMLDPVVRDTIAAARCSGEPHTCPGPAPAGLAVPVETGARPVVFWLEFDQPPVPDDEDRLLLTGLCERVVQALTRARTFDDHRAVAITLQRAILGPTDLPPGFAVRYEPAVGQLEVGGDWYDVVRLGEHCVGVVVGDCVGRGLGAAAVMGQLRSACRALLLQPNNPPSRVLAALDDFAALIPDASCTTLFCATIDLAGATMRYSSAGHPPGLLVHLDGGSELLDRANSVPLATMTPTHRPEATTTLRPGSTLLLYTDGLVEDPGKPLADGIAQARATLVEARELAPEAMATRLAATLLDGGHEDDVAYLVYQHPRHVPDPFSTTLAADARQLRPLRAALHTWLASIGVPRCPTAEGIVLAVSEAVANATEHAYHFDPARTVSLTGTALQDTVEIVVFDTGRWKPPQQIPADRGRGLLLMNHLMDEVAVRSDERGTTIRLRKGLR